MHQNVSKVAPIQPVNFHASQNSKGAFVAVRILHAKTFAVNIMAKKFQRKYESSQRFDKF